MTRFPLASDRVSSARLRVRYAETDKMGVGWFDYDVVPVGAAEPSTTGWTEHCGVGLEGRPRRLPTLVRGLFA